MHRYTLFYVCLPAEPSASSSTGSAAQPVSPPLSSSAAGAGSGEARSTGGGGASPSTAGAEGTSSPGAEGGTSPSSSLSGGEGVDGRGPLTGRGWPEARSGARSSSAAGAEEGGKGSRGGANMLGNLFNRLVKSPLGGLGSAGNLLAPDGTGKRRRGEGGAGGIRSDWVGKDAQAADAVGAPVPPLEAQQESSSSNAVGDAEGKAGGSSGGAKRGPSSSDSMVSTFKSFFGRSPKPLSQAGVGAVEEEEDSGDGGQVCRRACVNVRV